MTMPCKGLSDLLVASVLCEWMSKEETETEQGAFLVYSIFKIQILLLSITQVCPAWTIKERKHSLNEMGRMPCSRVCGGGANTLLGEAGLTCAAFDSRPLTSFVRLYSVWVMLGEGGQCLQRMHMES